MKLTASLAGAVLLGLFGGCASRDAGTSPSAAAADGAGGGDPVDVPVDGVTRELATLFGRGDALFGLPLRETDGLGPLYTRPSCGACHSEGLRGLGLVQKMVVVDADGVTPAADQSALRFGNTIHPLVAAGALTPVLPPDDARILVTRRIGPAILGRGYMEAIADAEIERVAAEQARRTDAIHGRPNHVAYASEANPDVRFHTHAKGDVVIGRFGLKARVATLDDFTADALQGDMGITSPLRPVEFANPDGLLDDRRPGVDVDAESVNTRAMYVRMVAIPRRSGARALEEGAGRAAFDAAKCSACHVPSLATRADYPLPMLAGIDAPIFSDLLVHDMGDALADGVTDGEAGPRDWRTAPLIGLRFGKTFLHDGRASSITDAILQHAGARSEADESARLFQTLDPAARAALRDFVGAL